ncbi:MAG: N-acetyltransferase [Sedimenticolaceae bacterium]|nr:N-acetyltransferase [Sedimenticolaceae bacterium]
MKHKILDKQSQEEITRLFTSVFTASEGQAEGELIGNLASKLASRIDDHEVICLGACEEDLLFGSIFFTRLLFSEPILVYMLAPVAVSTDHQGKGVGQALINFGLNELKNRAADIAITYGDPSFYSKVGFEPLSEDAIKAPLGLSMPEGWLGQSLRGERIPVIHDRPTCVREFNDPLYW